MSEIKKNIETKWKWKPKRWWIGLIIFWLISTVGAGIIARNGGSSEQESGFIIMIMLAFAIWAACTDRGWSIPTRIVWIVSIWIIHALLIIPILFTIGTLVYSVSPHLVNRSTSLFAAFPLVIWAMSRSRFFVELVIEKEEKQ
jgi:hypothetical protein